MTVQGISDRSWLLLSSGFAARALIPPAAAQEMAISAEKFARGVNPFRAASHPIICNWIHGTANNLIAVSSSSSEEVWRSTETGSKRSQRQHPGCGFQMWRCALPYGWSMAAKPASWCIAQTAFKKASGFQRPIAPPTTRTEARRITARHSHIDFNPTKSTNSGYWVSLRLCGYSGGGNFPPV